MLLKYELRATFIVFANVPNSHKCLQIVMTTLRNKSIFSFSLLKINEQNFSNFLLSEELLLILLWFRTEKEKQTKNETFKNIKLFQQVA